MRGQELAGPQTCNALPRPNLSLRYGEREVSAHDAAEGSTVLVVSTDPVLAALLGLLAELGRHHPVYARGEERPQAALSRYRPRLVLLDVEHTDGFSDAFLTHAKHEGAKVLVFGRNHPGGDLRQRAEARQVPWLALPTDPATFARTLAEALRASR